MRRSDPARVGDRARALALPLHVDGAAAIGNAQLYQRAAELASQLHTALDHRGVIERAKGMLMALRPPRRVAAPAGAAV